MPRGSEPLPVGSEVCPGLYFQMSVVDYRIRPKFRAIKCRGGLGHRHGVHFNKTTVSNGRGGDCSGGSARGMNAENTLNRLSGRLSREDSVSSVPAP